MNNKKSNDDEIKQLKYNLLGNVFLSNLFDMSGDLDNSGQNLVTYLELDEINKLSEKLEKDDENNMK